MTKILRLTAENIKRLSVVEITPKGNVVQITGKNGQGKTSVLDSIFWALAGTKNIQSQPINAKAQSARIRLDLGELIVTRRFTKGKDSTLIVENAEGARYGSPQKMIDALFGALTFDPLEFSRMESDQQFDQLRKLVKLDVDIDDLDAKNRGDFGQRTDVNRDLKAARATSGSILVPQDPGPRIETAELVQQLSQAGVNNGDIAKKQTSRQIEDDALEANKRELARLLQLVEQEREEIARIEERVAARAPLPEPVNTAALTEQIEKANAHNRAVDEFERKRDEKARKEAEAIKLEAQSNELTEAMEAREKAKTDAIAAAEMPIPGLGFGEGIVTFNGVPFDQASHADKIRVSMAIAIAMNPKLRVIRIMDGSLLDDDNMALIAQMADENDFQVWVEKVDASGKIGVVIEDGAVKADNQAAAE